MDPKTLYRATSSPELLKQALAEAKHLFVKMDEGNIHCVVHNRAAEECVPRSGNLVWHTTLDQGMYVASVVRIKPYRGNLTLSREGNVFYDRFVHIAYDAPFGPDLEDVKLWQALSLSAADDDYRKRGETPPA